MPKTVSYILKIIEIYFLLLSRLNIDVWFGIVGHCLMISASTTFQFFIISSIIIIHRSVIFFSFFFCQGVTDATHKRQV